MYISTARSQAIKFWFREAYYTKTVEVQPLSYPETCKLTLHGNTLAHRFLEDCNDLLLINVPNYNKQTFNLINEILEFTRTAYHIEYSAKDKRAYLRHGNVFERSVIKGDHPVVFINQDSRWLLYKY